jgi:hypothetical protein
MKPSSFLLSGILLLLSGCDAWPTILDNRSHHAIHFHYREHSHEEWSAEFGLKKGEAQTLAREHWVQDIVGLQIVEAGRRYSFDYAAMAPLRRACSSFVLSRRLKFTPDCYLTYQGSGRVSASYAKPARIRFHDFGNSS